MTQTIREAIWRETRTQLGPGGQPGPESVSRYRGCCLYARNDMK